MTAIPAKRLLVYVAAGVIVLGVGTTTAFVLRSGEAVHGGGGSSAVMISTGSVRETMSVTGGTLNGSDAAGSGSLPGTQTSNTTSTAAPTMFVQVAGAVRLPGVYQMPVGSRVFQVVERAGGFSPDADQEAVTLAATLADGCRVYIPRNGEVAEGAVSAPAVSGQDTGESSAGAAVGELLSINSAGIDELDELPGIGPTIAQDIVAYREANGPFASIEELADVPGIGPSRLERLRPLITL